MLLLRSAGVFEGVLGSMNGDEFGGLALEALDGGAVWEAVHFSGEDVNIVVARGGRTGVFCVFVCARVSERVSMVKRGQEDETDLGCS